MDVREEIAAIIIASSMAGGLPPFRSLMRISASSLRQ